jgi:hypothetical protein
VATSTLLKPQRQGFIAMNWKRLLEHSKKFPGKAGGRVPKSGPLGHAMAP